jgi:hypothetical protein
LKLIAAGKKYIRVLEFSYNKVAADEEDEMGDEEFEHAPQDPHSSVFSQLERDGEEHGVGSAGAEWGDKMAPIKANGFGFTRSPKA